MMEILLIALSGLSLVALSAVAFLLHQLRRARAAAAAAATGPRPERAGGSADELAMLASTSVGMGQRLDRVAADLRAVQERLDQVESRDPGANTYVHAIRMSERGKGVDELIDVFGVSRAEAELIRKLHPDETAAHRGARH